LDGQYVGRRRGRARTRRTRSPRSLRTASPAFSRVSAVCNKPLAVEVPVPQDPRCLTLYRWRSLRHELFFATAFLSPDGPPQEVARHEGECDGGGEHLRIRIRRLGSTRDS